MVPASVERLEEKIQGLYQWGTWDTKVFTQCGAKITQAYDPLLNQWGGFTVSMEDYASEVQFINLTPTRRKQMEQKVKSIFARLRSSSVELFAISSMMVVGPVALAAPALQKTSSF